jgi:hypothetical protein
MAITVTDPVDTVDDFNTINKSLLKKELRIKILNNIKKRIDDNDDIFYVFYAKPYTYDYPVVGTPPEEVPEPTNALNKDLTLRKSFTGFRKLNATDIRKAFKKYKWESGTTYSQYSNFVDLSVTDLQYYVYVENQKKIYICLNNANGGASTIEPSSDDTAPFKTSDGYTWQLIIEYEDSLIRKFSSESYLPEPNPESDQIKKATNGGTVDRFDINNDNISYDYDALTEIPFFIKGDGQEIKSAEARVIDVPQGGSLDTSSLRISRSGNGYYADADHDYKVPVEFRLKTESLTAAQIAQSDDFELAYGLAKVNVDNNSIESIEVKNIGKGYPTNSTVMIVQSSAIVYGIINDDTPSSIDFNIIQAGEDYESAKAVSVYETSETIDPIDPYINVIISPPNGHGSDIQNELNSTSLFINTRITNDDNIFSTSNDFRQIGIIENPLNLSGNKITENIIDAKLKIRIEAEQASDFELLNVDAAIEGQLSLQRGILVDVLDVPGEPLQRDVRYVRDPRVSDKLSFITNENLFVPVQQKSFRIIDVTNPDIDFSSGNVLFINNTTAIDRDIDQSETLNFIFNF